MAAHDAIAAIPADDEPDRDLAQALLISRYIYVILDSEDPTQLDPQNTETGAIAIGVAWQGRIFWYDADDSTTTHDGTTCLVLTGGHRYKTEGTNIVLRSVIDKDLTAPPGGESFGDAYIVGAAATGDWAAHDGELTVFTARGYVFIEPAVGMVIYVADEDAHYKYTSGGSWAVTFQIVAASVLPSHVVGGKHVWIVENATQNTPPSAPQGTAYIIGDTPTGAFVGHSGKVAFKETSGTGTDYVIRTPAEGWAAYDKDLNIPLRHDGADWVPAAGAIVAFSSVFTESGSETTSGTGSPYNYSASTPPVQTSFYTRDDAALTFTAKKAGAVLRFRWSGHCDMASDAAIGLFRDSETNAIDWVEVNSTAGAHRSVEFIVTAPDTDEHDYKVLIKLSTAAPLTRRTFTIEEFA